MRFRQGHVLYGSRRTYLRKVAVADFEGICANTTFVFESKDPGALLPELLPFVMSTETFHDHSIKQSKGSVNPYVNFTDLAWYEFALPPLDEQQKIVSLAKKLQTSVETACKLETSCQVALEALRVEWFENRNATRQELAELSMAGGIKIGPFGAQLHQSDYTDDGVPVVMPTDMKGEQISPVNIARIPEEKADELDIHRIFPGDIILPRRGELDRRALVRPENTGWICGTGSIRVRLLPEIPPGLLIQALASRQTLRWLTGNAVGTTMPNLNTKIVERIPVGLPARADWQQAEVQFSHLVSAIESATKRSLRSRALAGRVLDRELAHAL